MRTNIGTKMPGLWLGLCAAAMLPLCGCKGSRGSQGPPGSSVPSTTPTELAPDADPPGVQVTITELGGSSGSGGVFNPGDHVTVTFKVLKNDGTPWQLSEMTFGEVMVSGPSFNYQRVLAAQQDLTSVATAVGDGVYRYTFADPIPDQYLAPLNDTDSFGENDGELSGKPLLGGTYTVGINLAWSFTAEGRSYRDVGSTTFDFLLGDATALEARDVVNTENCNQCHQTLQAHGGLRRGVKMCLLCHTSGAEDRNVPEVAGGTPGASIDFRVMIHKIHAGKNLPSVLGVETNPNGSRNYAGTPKPYQLVGFENRIADFSEVGFPVMPNLGSPMPRDYGYSSLTTGQQLLEDTIRQGPAECSKCHGDADGSGPLVAPSQGDVAFTQPSRRACGACHDDVNFAYKYTSNQQTMPPQNDDATCKECHDPSGSSLAVQDAHVHPLNNPAINAGLKLKLKQVVEAGANDGDGTFDPGERVAVTFTIKDDSGAAVAPADLASISVVLSGPIGNRTLLLNGSIPIAILSGSQPYTINLPQALPSEFVGRATAALGDVFTTARAPHLNVTGALTTVQVRTGTSGGASQLTVAAELLDNFVEVASNSGFARNDWVVIDSGTATEEYQRIALVDGTRLWFTSTLKFDHAVAAPILEVTLSSKTENTDYTLDKVAGKITELTEFGDTNAVIVSYTSEFVMPAVYLPPFNDSPDLDDAWGEWKGKSLVDGTYTLDLWASRSLSVVDFGETTTYRGTSPAATKNILVGAATALDSYTVISSPDNCNACHNDLWFHGGGRRGFDTCIMCHGISGTEDRPRYTAGNAPATTGVTIDFRGMLHKIHMGADLAHALDYTVVGFGSAPYPDNYTAHTYGEVEFPAFPDKAKHCDTCHGAGSVAWQEPADRSHPTDQQQPVRVWRSACGSCHDADDAAAHIDSMTDGSGAEACGVCHGTDADFRVSLLHKIR